MTAYTFDKAPVTEKHLPSGLTKVLGQYELTGALADNDTVGDIPVPAGAFITDVQLEATELDTNASPTLTLNVGIFGTDVTDDEDAFVDGATTGDALNQQGINVSSISGGDIATGRGYKVPTDATGAVIRVTVDGAPATAATSGHVLLVVEYTMDAI